MRSVGRVRQVRHSLLTVSALRNVPCQPTEHTAMRYKNTKAHGTHCTMCPSSVHIRTHPYLSVRHCSQYRLCAMRSASQQTTQPCATKIQKHMALTAPCANRPTSPTSPTSPTFFARSIGSAQCTLPTSVHREIQYNHFCRDWRGNAGFYERAREGADCMVRNRAAQE